ncbi:MAG: tRNA 2-thiouridine(34) synthase MnmA [Candidatus Omnitrophota bacterium]|jgi:tRNA-specific 2-thiouridylase|nr:tRNA 2-thiouridine(34) synthase MnmA [Candidatus Omnitrophota bacterium]MDD3982723.1 tRNA 2-thiouridine(34) synthase MnmA [Candidatus Omnitrophota bacterium]MDD5525940.1 tRNA 2-thiouridine(34) synthase MnmA [Candidatus Omnitrophota bacterium]
MSKTAAVALSGGVDSAAAALLLKSRGFRVIGVTAFLSGNEDICAARRAAAEIGIEHRVFRLEKEFERKVIDNFRAEYAKGRTPNPCVRCNRYIKFGLLRARALSLGPDYFATGHYAKIENGRLKKAADSGKDQSYFLYSLAPESLKNTLFPLGGYTKEEVRRFVSAAGLNVSSGKESQDVCFVPGGDYRSFLASVPGFGCLPGEFVDTGGKVLGRHKGVPFYTVGQRQGLGISSGRPLYVREVDARRNRVVLGGRQEVLAAAFIVYNPSFPGGPLKKKVVLNVKIRYNHTEQPAEITPSGNTLKIVFRFPQFAVTPGQSAVIYRGDVVVGGGIIRKVLD